MQSTEVKLTLKNFEQLIDPDIVERGLGYYEDNSVQELEKISPGNWWAIVLGTNVYNVAVNTHRSVIKAWECDCPYEHGPICKHVVAVLYGIADKMNKDITSTESKTKTASKKRQTKRKTQKEQLEEIFEKAGKDDLVNFISKHMNRDTALRHKLLAHFADLIEDDLFLKYKQIVNNYINASGDEHGFIDYKKSNEFAINIQSLLDKANDLLKKDNINESIIICQAVIEGLAIAIQNMDDSNGLAGSQIEDAFEIISIAIGLLESPMMRDQLFEYFLKEFPKEKYKYFEIDLRFLEMMPVLISNENQEKQLFSLIDENIKKVKNELYPDWKITRLMKLKIDYLSGLGRTEEARKIILSGLEYHELRKILVDSLVNSGQYEDAKKFINEGLEIARGEDLIGIIHMWMEYLLRIAEKEKDIVSIRDICEQLFFQNTSGYMAFYKKLKKTFKPEEWQLEIEKLLDIIKGPKERGSWADLKRTADVFVEEQFWPRLLKLMQLNSGDFYFVLDYSKYLPHKYSNNLPDLLIPGLKQLAEPTGRGKYKDLARYMKRVTELPKGNKIIREMVVWINSNYNNRPAMLEIINGKFPEMRPKPIASTDHSTSASDIQTTIFDD